MGVGMVRWAIVLTLAAAMAGCGGGAGASAPGAPATPKPAPLPSAMGVVPATISIVVPAGTTGAGKARRPAFVSAGAKSLAVAIYPVAADGTIAAAPVSTSNVDLVPSPACQGVPLTCSIVVTAVPGTVTFSVSLYTQLGEQGGLLASFAPNAQHEFTILDNATNVIGISLNGVPAALSVTVDPPVFTAGAAATSTVSVVARDAAGYTIVGADPYAAPIVLRDADTSGTTTLGTTTLTGPTSSTTVHYNGGALGVTSFPLLASVPSTPLVTTTASIGIININGVTTSPASVMFLSLAQAPATVVYGEAAYNGGFTVAAASCSGTASVSDLGGSLRITPLHAGSCVVIVSDNASHSSTVSVGVTQTTVSGS